MKSLTDHINKEFRRFMLDWPNSTANELKKYFESYQKRINYSTENGQSRPYWIHLPQWIFFTFSANEKMNSRERKFLKDITWAQYCVFLAIRMHDDLYDGQTECKSVIYAGDRLLIESEKIFSGYFPKYSEFWEYYYKLIDKTIHSITLVDELQRSGKTSFSTMISSYADVCSIFKIGALAVCFRFGQMKKYKNISLMVDKYSIAGQMSDDLKDLEEDIVVGRFNSAYIFFSNRAARGQGKPKKNSFPIEDKIQFIKKIMLEKNIAEKIGEKIGIAECFKENIFQKKMK